MEKRMNDPVASWKRVHFVGIKGVAMAALALYCKKRGMRVTGSDTEEIFPTDEELAGAKIPVLSGFSKDHITKYKPDVVIYTGAHNGRDNTEVIEANRFGIASFPHGKALGMVMEPYRQIAVAGSHGKTTTSAMIATILSFAKQKPSFTIGCGFIGGLGAAGTYDTGQWFVAEADEYITDPGHDTTPRFLWMKPEILVVTNIDFDHPDVYDDLAAVQQAFIKFQGLQVGQKLSIVNIDDPKSLQLLAGKNVITYGFSPRADVHICHVGDGAERTFFRLEQAGVPLGEFTLRVPGVHNVANATAAIIAAQNAGVSIDLIGKGLLHFTGTKRRFEKIGSTRGVIFYDDYAHHPAEIEATLSAVKRWYPTNRIVAVFQPHTYSRTKALMTEFSRAFDAASVTVIVDIYASARESDTLGITAQTLISQISARGREVYFGKNADAVTTLLDRMLQPGDVAIFMGAGDIATWEKEVFTRLGGKKL